MRGKEGFLFLFNKALIIRAYKGEIKAGIVIQPNEVKMKLTGVRDQLRQSPQ